MLRAVFLAVLGLAASETTTESPQAALEEAEHVYKGSLDKANETLKSLQKWLEGIESSASKEGEVDEVANKILTEAKSEFEKEHDSMLDSFDKQLKDLSSAKDLREAAEELEKFSKQILKQSKAVTKAMKKKYHDLRSSQKDKAQDLMKEVMKGAHFAMKTARKVEHFGRKAGQKESEYEGNIGKAEKDTEGLSRKGEKYGERAEHVVEHFFEKVEKKVEDLAHDLAKKAKASQKEREQRIKDAVEEATPAAPAAFFLRGKTSPETLLGLVLPASGFAVLGLAVAWQRRRPSFSMPPYLG